jgi:hypothetical protein
VRPAGGKGFAMEEVHSLHEGLKVLVVTESSGVDADVEKQVKDNENPLSIGETIHHARKGESH